MVKVTIEDDRCKNEITGEFFMGLMITEEEKNEDGTTYKACAIGTGNTCVQDLRIMSRNGLSVALERCIKPSLTMLRQWQSLPSLWMLRSTRHLRRVRVRSQMKQWKS